MLLPSTANVVPSHYGHPYQHLNTCTDTRICNSEEGERENDNTSVKGGNKRCESKD